MTSMKRMMTVAIAAALFTGCGDDDGGGTTDMMTGTDMNTGAETGTPETGTPETGLPPECPNPDEDEMGCAPNTDVPTYGTEEPGVGATIVAVNADITTDTTWTADNVYQLDTTVYVSNATLTIMPGTVIQGAAGQNALVVTTSGRLVAEGTAADPIIFTSSNAVGEREPGDWGGVVLLGLAPINVEGGVTNIEGLDPGEARGQYGGDNAAHDCGSLRYVRIEWAGFVFGEDNELNGLTLGGCGTDTGLDFIQVHGGRDDGIEFFGGTANLSHAIVSQNGDDALDTDQGYVGNVQFFVNIQDGRGDNGLEGDNLEDAEDSTPRSAPVIFNATFIGNDNGDGLRVRRGSAGQIGNVVVQGFSDGDCAQADGDATIAQHREGNLSIEGLICFDNQRDAIKYEDDAEMAITDLDLGCDGVPRVIDPSFGTVDIAAPIFVPAACSAAARGAVANPGGFFQEANYLGAFEPG
ncbi:MAG: hypothetical protein AAF411_27065, partial [Myxococcota bacterium]